MAAKHKIMISEGQRPLWQIIIAAVFFTLGILTSAMFFFGYDLFPEENISLKGDGNTFYIAILCFSQGILFSVVKNIQFNLEKKQYKEQYRIGPFGYGFWKDLPKINYVSVFRQLKADESIIYEVNLWYAKNKHFNIYQNENKLPAYEMGEEIAKNIGVRLLDATVPNNNKWVQLA